tara:strand:- start:16125 stop:17039 length:915 start_codon:yes stop_codon:yes gene_type:complete
MIPRIGRFRIGNQTRTNQQKGTEMSLMIDSSKSDYVSEEYLAGLETRNKSNTHVAVPHHWFVKNIKKPLDDRKILYENMQIALSKDEETLFGTVELPEVCVPSVDAQYQLFRQTKLSPRDRHSLLVRLAKKGALPSSRLLQVEEEYLREDDDVLRDEHSRGHNVWRLLQAFTEKQKTGGGFQGAQSRLDATATRTTEATKMFLNHCDPDPGKPRLKEILAQPLLLNEEFSLAQTYKYMLGFRHGNRLNMCTGVVLGVSVMVCDNLCFSGEIEVKRKHTMHVLRDLPPMIESSIDKLLLGGIIAG